jgi:hypothetical protein
MTNGKWNLVGSRHTQGTKGMSWRTNWRKKQQAAEPWTSAIPESQRAQFWGDLNEQSVNQWQKEWERTSKGATTKSFFPKIIDRLKLRINATPNFTAIVTGHGNIKTYLFKYRIIESPVCSCEEGEQSVDHIIFECKLLEQERTRLKAMVKKWPVSKDKLSIKFYR